MQTTLEGSVLSFTDNADSLKEYVAINPAGDFLKPKSSLLRKTIWEMCPIKICMVLVPHKCLS